MFNSLTINMYLSKKDSALYLLEYFLYIAVIYCILYFAVDLGAIHILSLFMRKFVILIVDNEYSAVCTFF